MKKKKKKNPVSQEKTSDNKDIRKSSRSVQTKKISGKKPEKKMTSSFQQEGDIVKKKWNNSFPVVGIGASAGGLEAFGQLFIHMPVDSGAAFIVIQHLDPTHSSLLTDLLKRYTTMAVVAVEDGMRVEPNRVHVIPPNNDMVIQNGVLKLMVRETRYGLRMPIDFFLRSLAEDCGERAVCIILSGAGTDGTLGLKAINEVGGLAIVQDPATAKYDSMPKSAAKTGTADYLLPVESIPEQLSTYIKHAYSKKTKRIPLVPAISPVPIQKILLILKTKTGNDFSLYKKNTIYRRVEKRMHLHGVENASDYIRFLQTHQEEVQLLFKELLISVTRFFRDPEAFEVLKKDIVPGILEGKPENYTIRIWVPGCATGEEVYSIVMVLREYMDEIDREFKIQIFGTDIDEGAITTARKGIYPRNIALDVSPKRLKQFFIYEDDHYRVKREFRETSVFAVHNLIKDPPFSSIDLISCRNLLIYFNNELQNKMIPIFHYSLKPGGILFLGPFESIGGSVNFFTLLDKKWKFFKSKGKLPPTREIPLAEPNATYACMLRAGADVPKQDRNVNIEELVHKVLIESIAPPCVIVDEKGDILYIHGRTGKYLELAIGKASLNIISMAQESIRHELYSAIHNAVKQKKDIICEGLKVKTNDDIQTINLTVKYFGEPKTKRIVLLIVFEDVPVKQAETKKAKGTLKGAQSKRIDVLEWELKHSKEDLQATVTELQDSNEELRSLNEELQSTNEELQSTNEELETSKEELQSVNEELITVNSELQSKIDQLSRSENDMNNLLNCTNIGIIFLDKNLCINRFTKDATKVFNLIPSDIGRPIYHVVSNLMYENLVSDALTVLDKLSAKEFEVQTKDKHWYYTKIIPYKTQEGGIEGVVITFNGIDQIKDLQKLSEHSQAVCEFAENIIETVREPLIVLDENLRVILTNRSFCKIFQVKKEEMTGNYLYDLGNKQWDIPELRKLLEEILSENTYFEDYEITSNFPHIGTKTMVLNARKVVQEDKKSQLILLGIEDKTNR